MEEIECSVDICERDWECFFADCEECNLLPPLAGVDDSGMSESDDSILATSAQKVDLTSGSSEAGSFIDRPSDFEGSPVERYLGKHGIGGMESILSGSEEDIHLQSVNIFFESLKNLAVAERDIEPSPVKAEKNRAAKQEEELCSDGQQARSSTLPRSIPKLNSLPARWSAAGVKETAEPFNTISNVNTVKKIQPTFNIFHEPAASNSGLKHNISAQAETHLFIREEDFIETRVNEEALQKQAEDLPGSIESSEITTQTDNLIKVETCTLLDDVHQQDVLSSQANLDMVTRVKWKEDQNLNNSHSDAARTSKVLRQESSPSASVRRKRRKKRRLSLESRVSVTQRDSEEEQWRGPSLPDDAHLFDFDEPHNNILSASYSATSYLPQSICGKERQVKLFKPILLPARPIRYFSESLVRHEAAGSAENNEANTRLVGRPDDSVNSAMTNSANVATNSKACSELQVDQLAVVNPGRPVPVTDGAPGESDPVSQTPNSDAVNLQRSDELNHSIMGCENKHNLNGCTAEVSSVAGATLRGADSNDPVMEVSQRDISSATKSVWTAEVGNSDNHTLRQREAESQQQLETGCHNTEQDNAASEKTRFPPPAADLIGIDVPVHNTEPRPLTTTAGPSDESHSQETCAEEPSPDDGCLSGQDTGHHLETRSPCSSGDLELTTTNGHELSTSADPPISPSDVTPVSSCCTLDTGSIKSVSKENKADVLLSSSVSDSKTQGEQTSLICATHKEGDDPSGPPGQSGSHDTTEAEGDSVLDVVKVSPAECEPIEAAGSKHPVFAMSSFWRDMEKLTINDILGLRMMSKGDPSSSFESSRECQADMFAITDSDCFTPQDGSKQNAEAVKSNPVMALNSTSSGGVMWENGSVPVSAGAACYPETMRSLPGSSQQCPRKISKNISVHNLRALESESSRYPRRGPTLQTLDEGESEEEEHFADGPTSEEHRASDSTDGYRISVVDVFRYLFGGKPSAPSQTAPDDITACNTDGCSLPETYDHFFSEFDTGSFFYPLITSDQSEPVQTFSRSRSANTHLQFPEAYDYFFATSSSDDSSDEDDDDTRGPVRVVTRFSQKASEPQTSPDIYENFFGDSHVIQDLFWKVTLSFRNVRFSGSTAERQRSGAGSLVRPSGRSLRRATRPINSLGNLDVMLPDSRLYHLEDVKHPRYEDLQMAVSNPRLDASLLPLRQSDMCLVCIAFASWVLKTANPQVGDTWKAVLLANVSALSAIRYLRKYVKVEASASQKKLHLTASSDS